MTKGRPKLAFVLGGGGARGALQVGALRALFEHGLQPDLLVGTSAGAVNAVFLGLEPTREQVARLEEAWRAAATQNLFPADWISVVTRTLMHRAGVKLNPRLREFFIAHLPNPDVRFHQLRVLVYLVAADLNHARAVIYGEQPDQEVLEGLLASTALPPWVRPLEQGDQFLMDGGAVSNLPIEPALAHGATEIIALDLSEPADVDLAARGFGPFASKLLNTVARRQTELELRLAATQHVPVHHLKLRSEPPVMFWDFTHADELIQQGYALTRHYLDEAWRPRPATLLDRLREWRPVKRRVDEPVAEKA
jgi:NTE family protein